jgi:DNA-binding NarL/FixJ family response regulator
VRSACSSAAVPSHLWRQCGAGPQSAPLSATAEGCSNAAIAERLFLSPKTIEANIHQILRKLGIPEAPDVNRRVVAVLAYLRSA